MSWTSSQNCKDSSKKKKHKVDLQQQQKGIKDIKLKIDALEEICNTITDSPKLTPDKMKETIENTAEDLGTLVDAMKETIGASLWGDDSDDTADNVNKGVKNTAKRQRTIK
jgi:hypothetical protein